MIGCRVRRGWADPNSGGCAREEAAKRCNDRRLWAPDRRNGPALHRACAKLIVLDHLEAAAGFAVKQRYGGHRIWQN